MVTDNERREVARMLREAARRDVRNVSTNDLQANSDLLFCPFCGGEAHIKEVVSACEKLYTVGCSDSECMGYETWLLKPTVDEAVAAWNRRAERTARVKEDTKRASQTQLVVTKSCSECGHCFGAETHYERMFEGMVLNEIELPSYCPNCGSRVIEEES